jgi:hypothetical protein
MPPAAPAGTPAGAPAAAAAPDAALPRLQQRQAQLSFVPAAPALAPCASSSNLKEESPVWQYFKRIEPDDDGKDVVCTVATMQTNGTRGTCGYRMKAPPPEAGTGNYYRHLKKHPPEWGAAKEASARSSAARAQVAAAFAIRSGAQPTVDGVLAMSSAVRAVHDRRYVIWCAINLRPCTMIEEDGLKIFLGGFSPAYVSQVWLSMCRLAMPPCAVRSTLSHLHVVVVVRETS